MGGPWSYERHIKLAEKRMKEIKSGKAKTRFLFGTVAAFKVKGAVYTFSAGYERVELAGKKGNRLLFRKSIKGRKFLRFIEYITDWLRLPNRYVIYRKKSGKKRRR